MRVLYTSHELPTLPSDSVAVPDVEFTLLPADGVPSVDQLREHDVLCLVGQFANPDRSAQLAGVVRLALPHGLVVVVAYPMHMQQGIWSFLEALDIPWGGTAGSAVRVIDPHPAFADYFSVFGRSNQYLGQDDLVEDEVLGYIHLGAGSGNRPTAFCTSRGPGAVYVVPYYIAGAQGDFLRELLRAVTTHREGTADAVPPFLADLRLPGEQDLLDQIAGHEIELGVLRDRAWSLERYRHLIGRLSGDALETRVIETLNKILDGSGYSAIDREDVRREDFWIVGPDGDFALAEVKGQNSNVRRDDVNQVDSHREEVGAHVVDMAGLLIVNIFRGTDDLEQRRFPVAGEVVRRAASSNVLVLRTYDVYHLLARKMAGEDIGQQLIDMLGQDGGWLEVTPDTFELHT